MTALRCISPIDGSVEAEREALSPEAAAAVAGVQAVQREWAARPMAERMGRVLASTERLGAMRSSGQCRCGIERIYVHRSLCDGFVEGAVAEARKLVPGDPLDPEATLGPMANLRVAQVVRDQVEAAVAACATAHLPRLQADDGGTYLSPQVLTDVTHEMAVMREESIGPVVGIMPVGDDDDAVALMNDSAYSLTPSLWTANAERAEAIGARSKAGTVLQNRQDYLDRVLCWTGCKDTGRGGAIGVLGFHNLTRPTSNHLRKVTA